MAKFIYTDHACRKMAERGITKQTVEDVFYNHDEILPAEGESERAFRTTGDTTIVVTFEMLKRRDEMVKIISVHKKKANRR
jgi:hypothetical protein